MEPGAFRHKINIQRALDTQGERGGPSDEYTAWLTDIWAEVLPLQGRELWQAQQVSAEVTMKVRIRYRAGLNAKLRIQWQREPGSPALIDYLDVDGPPLEVEGRRDEVWLMCVRRDAEGFRTGAPS